MSVLKIKNGQGTFEPVLTLDPSPAVAGWMADNAAIPIDDWLDENVAQETGYVLDSTLTMSNAAAPADKVGELKSEMEAKSGLSAQVKLALMNLANAVVFKSDDPTGKTLIDALEEALYPPAGLTSITAVYTQSGTVYDDSTLDDLKPDLVVTANFDNGSTRIITNYILSGSLNASPATITASYGGFTDTFTVIVTERYPLPSGYTKYDWVQNSGASGSYVNTGLAFTYCGPEYHHKIKFKVPSYPSEEAAIYGGRGAHYGGTWSTEHVLWMKSNGTLRMGFSGGNRDNLYTAGTNELVTFETYHQTITVNGTAVFNTTTAGSYDTVTANITLFGYAWGTGGSANYVASSMSFKIYGFDITNEQGNYIAHYTPCTNGDGKAGFYDHVSESFKSSSSITLTAGNDS